MVSYSSVYLTVDTLVETTVRMAEHAFKFFHCCLAPPL